MKYNYEDWEKKFKPIKNHITTEERPFDGCMFETFGLELRHVLSVANKLATIRCVWTQLDSNKVVIAAGYHLVNRIGYFITEVPADSLNDCMEEQGVEGEGVSDNLIAIIWPALDQGMSKEAVLDLVQNALDTWEPKDERTTT